MADARVAEVLAACRFVLLDFDGPVCHVFAGHPADRVADALRRRLGARHAGPLPDDVASTKDPLVVVRRVAEFAPHLSGDIDAALGHAELHAITTAEPTPGGVQFLRACQATGRPVAIVSNNSTPAIEAYLRLHEIDSLVQHVQGRDGGDPRRMKPDPFLLTKAVTALDADLPATLMIGDSGTDVEAGHACAVPVIGLVNKPGKHQTLSHADALIADMTELADALRRSPHANGNQALPARCPTTSR